MSTSKVGAEASTNLVDLLANNTAESIEKLTAHNDNYKTKYVGKSIVFARHLKTKNSTLKIPIDF